MAKPAAVHVSDHALLRWLERVHGIEIEALRAVLTELIREAAVARAATLKLDGFTYILEGGHLITVLSPDQRTKRRRPKHFREAAE